MPAWARTRAGRSVAAGDETEDGLLGLGPRPQHRPHAPGSFAAPATSSVPRSTSTPRSASAAASTVSTSICRISDRCGKAVSGSARSASRMRTTRPPRCRSAAGAVSARASSACVTASGRSTSSVRACMISAREGRKASGRRSMIRTSAPWSWACRARARPAGPAPTTRMRAGPVMRPRPGATRPPHPPRRRPGAAAAQQFVAAQPGQHGVVDRTRHRHQREHPPQGARVVLGAARAIPLIQAPVAAALVVGQPQLRDEAREADKQRAC